MMLSRREMAPVIVPDQISIFWSNEADGVCEASIVQGLLSGTGASPGRRKELDALDAASMPIVWLVEKPVLLKGLLAVARGAGAVLPGAASRQTIHQYALGLLRNNVDQRKPAWRDARQQLIENGMLELRRSIHGSSLGKSSTIVADIYQVLESAIDQSVIRWTQAVSVAHPATAQHSMLVASLTAAFTTWLGVETDRRITLTRAAALHDVGKASIPLHVLEKPTALSAAEMRLMETHPARGVDMLSRQGIRDRTVLTVVLHHHEAWNGRGYPGGLSGPAIPESARIVSICDVFAALVERRAYKPALSPQAALDIMDGMTGRLDPEMWRKFQTAFALDG